MPPHSIGSGTISFGLVSIPVKLYPAASSQAVAFNMLHAKCGSRIRQQRFCPGSRKRPFLPSKAAPVPNVAEIPQPSPFTWAAAVRGF